MPIEFRCPSCNKLLRTGDETAGKKAKCPGCGAIADIPSPGTSLPPSGQLAPPFNPFGAAPSSPAPGGARASGPSGPFVGGGSPFGPPPPPSSDNPYQSPGAYPPSAPYYGQAAVPGAFTPTQIDFSEVFNRSWEIFKEKMGPCILAVLAVMGIQFGLAFVVGMIAGVVAAATKNPGLAEAISMALNFASIFLSIWFWIGQSMFFLNTARGRDPSVGEVFQGGPYFLTALVATLLFGIAFYVGLILCIVPGVILGLMFSQFMYLIVDRNAGITESLSLSKEITTGNKATLFVLFLVIGLLNVAGVLACFVGVIFTSAFGTLTLAVAYLMMTGQATAGLAYRPGPAAYAPAPSASPFGPQQR